MVATSVGQGFTRFLLTYSPEGPNTAYGQMIVTVDRFERMAELMPRIEANIMGAFPESLAIANAVCPGPGRRFGHRGPTARPRPSGAPATLGQGAGHHARGSGRA